MDDRKKKSSNEVACSIIVSSEDEGCVDNVPLKETPILVHLLSSDNDDDDDDDAHEELKRQLNQSKQENVELKRTIEQLRQRLEQLEMNEEEFLETQSEHVQVNQSAKALLDISLALLKMR